MIKSRHLAFFIALTLINACSPTIGSSAWCEDMDDKPKGDWTANEAGQYTKHCVFRSTEQ